MAVATLTLPIVEPATGEPDDFFRCPVYRVTLRQRVCVNRQFKTMRGSNGSAWSGAKYATCCECPLGQQIATRFPAVVAGRERPKPLRTCLDTQIALGEFKGLEAPSACDRFGRETLVLHEAVAAMTRAEDEARMERLDHYVFAGLRCRHCGRKLGEESPGAFCGFRACRAHRDMEAQAIREGRAVAVRYSEPRRSPRREARRTKNGARYSDAQRRVIVHAVVGGSMTAWAAAAQYGVARQTVVRWLRAAGHPVAHRAGNEARERMQCEPQPQEKAA